MNVFEVSGPEWLDEGDMTSCEQCGHWSSFSAGFEYDDGEYVRGWYNDEMSCYNWIWYYVDEGTVENFWAFLTEMDTDEAKQILNELNRLGL